jgi:polyisoprenoid-binding protein YceI
MKYILFFLFFLCIATPSKAKDYEINYEESAITFSGTHAGNEFEGQFEDWTATVSFDEENLDQSTAIITIDTESAKTGNPMYDGTLPTKDWFDVKTYPTIKFTANQFEKTLLGFTVTGDLDVKGKTRQTSFEFDLQGISPKTVTATFPINRISYDIGTQSDPSAEWVSENIDVKVKFVTK